MNSWLNLIDDILAHGTKRNDRTGTGTTAVFGRMFRVKNDVHSFPAVTTKQLGFGQVKAELAGFLAGASTVEGMHAHGCNIWDANASAPGWVEKNGFGYLGRIYGVQWRHWQKPALPNGLEWVDPTVDQLKNLVAGLIEQPHSRRHIVTALNPGEADDMCLPPCHVMFQCFVEDGNLDLMVTMRSVDVFLGLPFDIASYALLQRILAQQTGLKSRMLTFSLGDAHIYNDHVEQCKLVSLRTPFALPTLMLDPEATIDNFVPSMAVLEDYYHHGKVEAKMSV